MAAPESVAVPLSLQVLVEDYDRHSSHDAMCMTDAIELSDEMKVPTWIPCVYTSTKGRLMETAPHLAPLVPTHRHHRRHGPHRRCRPHPPTNPNHPTNQDGEPRRPWFKLFACVGQTDQTDQTPAGSIEMVLRWAFNPYFASADDASPPEGPKPLLYHGIHAPPHRRRFAQLKAASTFTQVLSNVGVQLCL